MTEMRQTEKVKGLFSLIMSYGNIIMTMGRSTYCDLEYVVFLKQTNDTKIIKEKQSLE